MTESTPILVGACSSYRILERSAAGAMGQILRAVDASGRTVAIKRATHETADARLRFQREIAALAKVDHPAVVSVLDHGEDHDGAWFAMDWIEGETLRSALTRGPAREADVLALAKRLATALAAIHAQDIVHRDVKPANILLPKGLFADAVLVDFGLARGTLDAQATQSGAMIGTPMYMSPEQARGEVARPASDLFSLGITLYECASGRPPFRGSNALAVLAKVLTLRPEPLGRFAAWSVGRFEHIVEALLRRNPLERPSSANELLAALENLDAHCPDRNTGLTLSDIEVRPATVLVARAKPIVDTRDETQSLLAPDEEVRSWANLCAEFGGVAEIALHPTLFVTFGSVRGARDQARLAARAALALRARAPHTSVSLATGASYVSESGASELTADLADSALRLLEGDDSGPGVMLDSATVGLLDATFVVEKCNAAEAARLVGRTADSDLLREVRVRKVPIVGREPEARALETLIRQSQDELQPTVAWVIGDAGRGKTTLRGLLASRLDAHGSHRVLQVRCDSLAEGVPYALLADLISARFPFSREGTFVSQRDALLPVIVAEGISTTAAEALAMPFGVVDAVGAADPAAAQDRLVRAMKEWFTRDAEREHPLVILIDDAHWSDTSSWTVLEQSLQGVSAAVSLVAFARPEFLDRRPRPLDGLGPREMPIPKLTARESERLFAALLGESTVDPGPFVRMADGNPLFLEELARTQAMGTSPLVSAPVSMLAMLQTRCASLPSRQRVTLRVAAVLGNEFSCSALREVLEPGDSAALYDTLLSLWRADFVEPRGESREREEWTFRHALVRDAAYALLAPEDRKVLHARIYELAKRLGTMTSPSLAMHAEQASLTQRAAAELVAVAEALLAASDLEGATAVVRKILGFDPPATVRGEAMVIGAIANFFQGDFQTAFAWASEGLASSARKSRLWVRAVGYIAAIQGHARLPERPPILLESMRHLAERPYDRSEAHALAESIALCSQTSSAMYPEDRQWTESAAERLIQIESDSLVEEGARGWASLGLAWQAFYVGGTPKQAEVWCGRAAESFARANDSRNIVPCMALWARVLASRGEREGALQKISQAWSHASQIGGFPVLFATLHRGSVFATLAIQGKVTPAESETAREQLEETLGALQQSAYVRCEANAALALLASSARTTERALSHAEKAIEAVGPCPLAAQALAVAVTHGNLSRVEQTNTMLGFVHASSVACLELRQALRSRGLVSPHPVRE